MNLTFGIRVPRTIESSLNRENISALVPILAYGIRVV